MNCWRALIRREWLEHRGGLLLAPLAMLVLLVVVIALLSLGDTLRFLVDSAVAYGAPAQAAAGAIDGVGALQSDPAIAEAHVAARLEIVRHGIARPFAYLYFGVAYFVLLGALYEERRDRTVLFWKSMPVSDTRTVLSKLIAVVWLAPLLTIAVIVVAQLLVFAVMSLLLAGAAPVGGAAIWSHAGLVGGAAALLLGYFTNGFWMLPLWGWLLLVSVCAPRLPFIWAALLPGVPSVLEWALFNSSVVFNGIVNHLSARALPFSSASRVDAGQHAVSPPEMIGLWATTDMWLGIACGAIFIAAAILIRRRNNEI